MERFAGGSLIVVVAAFVSIFSPCYTGPFVGNTSFPLLLIGNTDDPASPIVKYVIYVSIPLSNTPLTMVPSFSAHTPRPKVSTGLSFSLRIREE